jgi:hypothetical protein
VRCLFNERKEELTLILYKMKDKGRERKWGVMGDAVTCGEKVIGSMEFCNYS